MDPGGGGIIIFIPYRWKGLLLRMPKEVFHTIIDFIGRVTDIQHCQLRRIHPVGSVSVATAAWSNVGTNHWGARCLL